MDLPSEARSVSEARRRLRDLLADAPGTPGADAALLALSEVVTNALVHTGDPVRVQVWASERWLRVEVADGSSHLPVQRHHSVTAGTGRGLHLLTDTVDRWGAAPTVTGKVVWFELGERPERLPEDAQAPSPAAVVEATVPVTLLDLPLLVHWAWQEHARSLLREYLLFALESEPDALDTHAEASDALTVLHEQVPVPDLPEDPEELLAGAVEPEVTARRIDLAVPVGSVPHFATLDAALGRARDAAADGAFLGPPTQPEIREFRSWLCAEVARQSAGEGPLPWAPRTDLQRVLADGEKLQERYRDLLDHDGAALASDEDGVIVAVTPAVVRFLGHRSEGDLVGRRVLTVVPDRYHQAHVAGITLNATNGRDRLLHVDVSVPVVRADGGEVLVEMHVAPQRLDHHHRVFVARFTLPAG